MEFCFVKDLRDLTRGYGNIPEPPAGAPVYPGWGKEDWLLVPGTRFDSTGNRIGSGKGYYDRFLKTVSTPRWGVAWEHQISETPWVPELWDVPMDGLFTEKRILPFKSFPE
jgi:5-formyltetrahydrofolate cyclo-ligase